MSLFLFFFKQKTAYEVRISDWSSDVCSSDLRIASMTKPVTSVAFMMLVEQGLVALDEPVTKILPEFADLAVGADGSGRMRRPMLMIDLLRHTSGLTYGLQRQTAIDERYRELGLEEFQQKSGSDEFTAALAD